MFAKRSSGDSPSLLRKPDEVSRAAHNARNLRVSDTKNGWRECMGVEPTWDGAPPRNGFEDREGWSQPFMPDPAAAIFVSEISQGDP